MKKLISICLLLLCVGIIFNFSRQPADYSNATSKALSQIVSSWLIPEDYPNREIIVRSLNSKLRDTAHVFEYFLLSFLFLIFVGRTKIKLILCYILGFITIFVIAYIDENIQIPVAGRAFEWIDIGKDMFGYMLAMLLLMPFQIYLRLRKKRPVLK